MDNEQDEPEEDDELDEAEALNEAIARTDEERALFTQMDRDRKANEEAAWYASGNTGKLFVFSPVSPHIAELMRVECRPERLIQEYELPEVYRMEHVSQVVVDEIFEDRRSRVKTNVHYDDGLTEEQWLAVRIRILTISSRSQTHLRNDAGVGRR